MKVRLKKSVPKGRGPVSGPPAPAQTAAAAPQRAPSPQASESASSSSSSSAASTASSNPARRKAAAAARYFDKIDLPQSRRAAAERILQAATEGKLLRQAPQIAALMESCVFRAAGSLNADYRKSVGALCVRLKGNPALQVLADAAVSVEAFAEACVAQPRYLGKAGRDEERERILSSNLAELTGVQIGGSYTAGVCKTCKRQILPEWGECHSHWGQTCEPDNACTCGHGGTPGSPGQQPGLDPRPVPKRQRTTAATPAPNKAGEGPSDELSHVALRSALF